MTLRLDCWVWSWDGRCHKANQASPDFILGTIPVLCCRKDGVPWNTTQIGIQAQYREGYGETTQPWNFGWVWRDEGGFSSRAEEGNCSLEEKDEEDQQNYPCSEALESIYNWLTQPKWEEGMRDLTRDRRLPLISH